MAIKESVKSSDMKASGGNEDNSVHRILKL